MRVIRPTGVQLYRGCPPNPHANPASFRKQALAYRLYQTFPALLLIQREGNSETHWQREMSRPMDYFIHRVIGKKLTQ